MKLINKSFEDIIYTIDSEIKKMKQLPIDLGDTNTQYLKQLFHLFNSIDGHKISFFKYNKNSGFTTALLFLAAYFSFSNYNITIITQNKSKVFNKLKLILEFYSKIFPNINKIDPVNNKWIVSTDDMSCEINILSGAFNVSELKGIVMFDMNEEITNEPKYNDMILNIDKYGLLIMNFIENDYFINLAVQNNREIIDIKLK